MNAERRPVALRTRAHLSVAMNICNTSQNPNHTLSTGYAAMQIVQAAGNPHHRLAVCQSQYQASHLGESGG